MNPRIRELVKQAGGDFWQRLENDVLKKDAYITFDPPENLAKFVELIIRECIQTLRDNTPVVDEHDSVEDWDRGYIRGMVDCEHHITEHFGVER